MPTIDCDKCGDEWASKVIKPTNHQYLCNGCAAMIGATTEKNLQYRLAAILGYNDHDSPPIGTIIDELEAAINASKALHKRMGWQQVTPEAPVREKRSRSTILLASEDGCVLGQFSARKACEFTGRGEDDDGCEDWWINETYYDGDNPPKWWMVLPAIPEDE